MSAKVIGAPEGRSAVFTDVRLGSWRQAASICIQHHRLLQNNTGEGERSESLGILCQMNVTIPGRFQKMCSILSLLAQTQSLGVSSQSKKLPQSKFTKRITKVPVKKVNLY